jgi:hypothetical protein
MRGFLYGASGRTRSGEILRSRQPRPSDGTSWQPKIDDVRVLTLIRRYLEAGMMGHGLVQRRKEGTPQGGPLSPLLSNILLTELDRELERRGHAFCR